MLIKTKIVLCLGSSCFARGNQDLIPIIKKFVIKHQLDDKVEFRGDHCFSNCAEGPNMMIGTRMFSNISAQNIESILEEELNDIIKYN